MEHEKLTPFGALDGQNTLITGGAGTGKSVTLRHTIAEHKKAGARIAVTGSTGVAGQNIEGRTIHSWAGIGLGPRPGESFADAYQWLLQNQRTSARGFRNIREASTLVIDEVSMLSGRLLDYLNFVFQMVRDCELPFGGITIIFAGDFLQLPPVDDIKGKRKLPFDWAFQSRAWQEAEIASILLQKNWRQAEDPEFFTALSGIRMGRLDESGRKLLGQRAGDDPDLSATRIFYQNEKVRLWNKERLDAAPYKLRVFESALTGNPDHWETLLRNCPSPRFLALKPGVPVLVTRNAIASDDAMGAYVNGSRGIVEGWAHDTIDVRLDTGKLVSFAPAVWKYNERDADSATVQQFPLRLAFATTIHKAQGLTLSEACVSLEGAFSPGAAYVALSRTRSLDGLYFHGEPPRAVCADPTVVKYYSGLSGTPA